MIMTMFNQNATSSRRLAAWKQAFVVPSLASLLLVTLAATASAQPATTSKLISDLPLTTKDGWQIAITYYESTEGEEAPVVVLLPSKGGSRLDWKTGLADKSGKWTKGLADRLHREGGFAVVAVDLRGHGQARGPGGLGVVKPKKVRRKGSRGAGGQLKADDYKRMVLLDMAAVKKFIKKEHQDKKLNMRKMAIISADDSVPIAAYFAYNDWREKPYSDAPTIAARTPRGQDVRALVMLSPVEKVPGVHVSKPLTYMKDRVSFLICTGERDSFDKGATKKVNQYLTGSTDNKENIFMREYPTKYRGTDLIGRRLGVETNIMNFLKLRLKSLSGPTYAWRDRKNKLLD